MSCVAPKVRIAGLVVVFTADYQGQGEDCLNSSTCLLGNRLILYKQVNKQTDFTRPFPLLLGANVIFQGILTVLLETLQKQNKTHGISFFLSGRNKNLT